MLGDALLLGLGLLLLVGGGEALVRGATGLARGLGVSPLVIGLTVVAFGTSAPELAVNLMAALEGRGDISFGNVIGSNLANIGLIVGCTALIRPILVDRVVIFREIPMMLLATAAAVVLAFDRWLSSGPDVYDRADGIVFLMLFCVFLYYTVGDFVTQRANHHREALAGGSGARDPGALRRQIALTVAGLAALIVGGHVSVSAAVDLARTLGVPEVIIALTVLAIGTSLPELTASIVASLRGHVELAIGNVVGSNIFNLLFVAGLTATLRPIPVPAGGFLDLWVLAALSLILITVSLTRLRHIVRTEAALLLLCYLGYLAWRAAGSGQL
jgi:cation:H+ antiporter